MFKKYYYKKPDKGRSSNSDKDFPKNFNKNN